MRVDVHWTQLYRVVTIRVEEDGLDAVELPLRFHPDNVAARLKAFLSLDGCILGTRDTSIQVFVLLVREGVPQTTQDHLDKGSLVVLITRQHSPAELGSSEVNLSWLSELDQTSTAASSGLIQSDRLHVKALSHFADGRCVVVLNIVLQTHPENPIILDVQIEQLSKLWSPLVRVIGPVATPLLMAPGISEFEQTDDALVSGHFNSRDDTVSMVADESHVREFFVRHIFLRGGRTDYESFLVGVDDLLPHVFAIFVVNEVAGGASECSQRFRAPAGHCALVVAVDLGPCFFNEQDPHLISFALGEARLEGVLPAGEVVIHDNVLELAIHTHPHHVTPCVVLVVSLEDFFNALGELSDRCNGRQEVAVAQRALQNVIGRDALIKHAIILPLKDLAPSMPLNLVPSLERVAFELGGLGIVERVGRGREVRVVEELAGGLYLSEGELKLELLGV